MLAPNIIIPYDSTEASIPSGWTRDARFDSKFIKGAESSLASTGGATTHNHTANHTHVIDDHTHTISTGGPESAGTHSMGTSGSQQDVSHDHEGESNNPAGTPTTSATNVTFSTESNLPQYYDVLFIKSDAYNLIPQNGLIFRSSSRPVLTYHSASEDKFLRGADVSTDAGGTGGNQTHAHTQSHTHTPPTHYHAGVTDVSNDASGEDGQSSPGLAPNTHTHNFDLASSTQNMQSNTDNSGTTSLEPLHRELMVYEATSNSVVMVGDIALTTETTNPIGWITCDGTNGTPDMDGYYIKNVASPSGTAGANTHTHTFNHGHAASGSHTHSTGTLTSNSGTQGGHNGSGRSGIENHQHKLDAVSTESVGYQTATVSTTSVNNEPPYIQVKFIMATNAALTSCAALISLL